MAWSQRSKEDLTRDEIQLNIIASWVKTKRINNRFIEDEQHAKYTAWRIAKDIVERRKQKAQEATKTMSDMVRHFQHKIDVQKSFTHPDYLHVHEELTN